MLQWKICYLNDLIQGAHICSVADIKREPNLTFDQKLFHAINGENGLWLCANHHRLFDQGLIYISSSGMILYPQNLNSEYTYFIDSITTNKYLTEEVLTPVFLEYLEKRNSSMSFM